MDQKIKTHQSLPHISAAEHTNVFFLIITFPEEQASKTWEPANKIMHLFDRNEECLTCPCDFLFAPTLMLSFQIHCLPFPWKLQILLIFESYRCVCIMKFDAENQYLI